MKRFFFLAIAAVGMTVACQKQEISNAPADPMDDGTPVPVVFGTNVSSSVTTKAALDAWTGNEDLVIYGFKTGADLSVTDATNAAYGYLVNGVKVDSPASGTTGEVTIPDTFYGKEDSYDFYGYYAAGVDGPARGGSDCAAGHGQRYLPYCHGKGIRLPPAAPGGNRPLLGDPRNHRSVSCCKGLR